MHTLILDITEIKSRGEAIGYHLGQIARDAGVHPTSAYRAARADGTIEIRLSSLTAMTDKLVAREQALLAHLSALYPEEIARLGRRPMRRRRAA